MTDIKFEILKNAYVKTPRTINRSELLKESGNSINRINYAIDELVFSHLLKENIGSDYLSLTSKGAVEYEVECEARELRAIEDDRFIKNYRFNRNTTIISIAVAAAATVAAIIEALFLFC